MQSSHRCWGNLAWKRNHFHLSGLICKSFHESKYEGIWKWHIIRFSHLCGGRELLSVTEGGVTELRRAFWSGVTMLRTPNLELLKKKASADRPWSFVQVHAYPRSLTMKPSSCARISTKPWLRGYACTWTGLHGQASWICVHLHKASRSIGTGFFLQKFQIWRP